ncbi:Hypothetical predicted protein [Lecanosticta acicola]|uniref:Uncharacterized protein n=1 Tax=Lecanosticta acicola TaxID=111012 RepID=A0AAI9EFM4_9PEZI|nr:Hypothetical predicted protein [Lecanosticta acicola]
MFSSPGLALTALLAVASAFPTTTTTINSTLETRDVSTINLHVYNNCPFPKAFAIYQIAQPAYEMIQKSSPITLEPKTNHILPASFYDLGMRLSGHAEWGTARQWNAQALFEFGYAVVGGKKGTAYNLSVMKGSDENIGVGVYPIANGQGSGTCHSKTCFPWDCPLNQGWTDPAQVKVGSPADDGCYTGAKTDFKVVFCP